MASSIDLLHAPEGQDAILTFSVGESTVIKKRPEKHAIQVNTPTGQIINPSWVVGSM